MERYIQNRILKPPLHHKSFAYTLQNVPNLTIQSVFQRATLLQQCKEQYIEAEIDLLQTRWNTKCKIQNYCKLGGIQKAKYKPVAN